MNPNPLLMFRQPIGDYLAYRTQIPDNCGVTLTLVQIRLYETKALPAKTVEFCDNNFTANLIHLPKIKH